MLWRPSVGLVLMSHKTNYFVFCDMEILTNMFSLWVQTLSGRSFMPKFAEEAAANKQEAIVVA